MLETGSRFRCQSRLMLKAGSIMELPSDVEDGSLPPIADESLPSDVVDSDADAEAASQQPVDKKCGCRRPAPDICSDTGLQCKRFASFRSLSQQISSVWRCPGNFDMTAIEHQRNEYKLMPGAARMPALFSAVRTQLIPSDGSEVSPVTVSRSQGQGGMWVSLMLECPGDEGVEETPMDLQWHGCLQDILGLCSCCLALHSRAVPGDGQGWSPVLGCRADASSEWCVPAGGVMPPVTESVLLAPTASRQEGGCTMVQRPTSS